MAIGIQFVEGICLSSHQVDLGLAVIHYKDLGTCVSPDALLIIAGKQCVSVHRSSLELVLELCLSCSESAGEMISHKSCSTLCRNFQCLFSYRQTGPPLVGQLDRGDGGPVILTGGSTYGTVEGEIVRVWIVHVVMGVGFMWLLGCSCCWKRT